MSQAARRGAVKLEYALIAMLISGLGISFIGGFGQDVNSTFGMLGAVFDDSEPTPGDDGGDDDGGDDADDGDGKSRSGLGDGTNPGRGDGRDNSPNDGTLNPHNESADGDHSDFY
ncbi:MAG: Flp pilus assembly pilin Flp [Myxococcota bacterium]|jgi:Flp pilus assembly pilin Flp